MLTKVNKANDNLSVVNSDNAYISGQISHTTRGLLQSKTQSEALSQCKIFFDKLALSGFFKLTTHVKKESCFFGDGLKKKHILQLQTFLVSNKKINNNSHLLSIKMPSVYVLIDIEPFSETFKDALLDNIAIFVDSIQAWCDNFNDTFNLLNQLHTEKVLQVEGLKKAYNAIKANDSNLSESHNLMRQNLVCTLFANFPTMALEQDQENKILAHIEQSCEEHKKVLTVQLEANNKMCSLINSTMDMLLSCQLLEQLKSPAESTVNESLDVELF